jgi:hypothetical protein
MEDLNIPSLIIARAPQADPPSCGVLSARPSAAVTVVVPKSRPVKQVVHPLWPWQEHIPSPHYPRRFRQSPSHRKPVLALEFGAHRYFGDEATGGKAVTLASIRVSSMGGKVARDE